MTHIIRASKCGGAILVVVLVIGTAGYYWARPQPEPPPGSMILLPGYRHARDGGIDTEYGRIWKWWGPEIEYEIGFFKPDLATVLPGVTSITTRTVNGETLTLIRQTDRKIAVMLQDANFEAKNVTTQKDIDDLLWMVTTYSSERWKRAQALRWCLYVVSNSQSDCVPQPH